MESGTSTVLHFEEPTQLGKQLILEASVLPVINFAMGHNGAPLVQTVSVQNDTDTEWTDLELEITASPAFVHPLLLTPSGWCLVCPPETALFAK